MKDTLMVERYSRGLLEKFPRNKFMFKGHNPYVLIIFVTNNLIYVHYEGALVQDPSTEPTKPSNKLVGVPKAKLTLHRVLLYRST